MAQTSSVLPSFSADAAHRFVADYGLAVHAVAVRVSDAVEAFRASVDAGALLAFELYGDAVLRPFPELPTLPSCPGSRTSPTRHRSAQRRSSFRSSHGLSILSSSSPSSQKQASLAPAS
ncbi:hypothetical protein SEVIR_9G337577v4 [Setaria viridis]